MKFHQHEFSTGPNKRGLINISGEIEAALPGISDIKQGMINVFIKHTSASLCITENADPDVPLDLEDYFRRLAPDSDSWYRHVSEGPDDLAAHIKSVIIGSSLNLPITNGRINLGVWQGIFLFEHRNRGGKRNIVVTAWGI